MLNRFSLHIHYWAGWRAEKCELPAGLTVRTSSRDALWWGIKMLNSAWFFFFILLLSYPAQDHGQPALWVKDPRHVFQSNVSGKTKWKVLLVFGAGLRKNDPGPFAVHFSITPNLLVANHPHIHIDRNRTSIPVRYSGSGTGSDSSSWHWTSVGTEATTIPSGSCCSMPRAKFFCLVFGGE